MMKRIFIAAALMTAVSLDVFAYGNDGETQTWVQFWGSANITDTVSIKLIREDRYKDSDKDKHYYGHYDVAPAVKLGKNWSFSPALRFVHTLRGGEWRDDLMPHVNLMHKAALGPVTLKNRMRLAKQDREGTDDDPFEYQHKTDLVLTKGWTAWNVRPYVAEEWFYDFDEADLTRSRAYSGLLVSPVKKVSIDLFVMREDSRKVGYWASSLVFGVSSGYEF